MCYYEQITYPCGDWKWGNFRQHCTKEYRTGETCGMRLMYDNFMEREFCKCCKKIVIKENKLNKEHEKIHRWRKEGNKKASIEKSQTDIQKIEKEIRDLQSQRSLNSNQIDPTKVDGHHHHHQGSGDSGYSSTCAGSYAGYTNGYNTSYSGN